MHHANARFMAFQKQNTLTWTFKILESLSQISGLIPDTISPSIIIDVIEQTIGSCAIFPHPPMLEAGGRWQCWVLVQVAAAVLGRRGRKTGLPQETQETKKEGKRPKKGESDWGGGTRAP